MKNGFIESVWTTKALARAAMLYHSKQTEILKGNYNIIEREINRLVKK